jgi:superfamily II DNA/RNA helicase
VLDEADRLLSDTFAEHLATILAHIPARRQTLLFSATMTEDPDDLALVGCSAPVFKWAVTSSYVACLLLPVHAVHRMEQKRGEGDPQFDFEVLYSILIHVPALNPIPTTGRRR